MQRYEGASTIFGPHTLQGYIQVRRSFSFACPVHNSTHYKTRDSMCPALLQSKKRGKSSPPCSDLWSLRCKCEQTENKSTHYGQSTRWEWAAKPKVSTLSEDCISFIDSLVGCRSVVCCTVIVCVQRESQLPTGLTVDPGLVIGTCTESSTGRSLDESPFGRF